MSATSKSLVLALLLLTAIAYIRPPEYDEAYSIFLTAHHARPAWPATPFHPSQIRGFYAGAASLGQIARDLRGGDVHPPLYFWSLALWRHAFGPAWFAARLLSVLYGVAALAVLGRLARMTKVPTATAILLCLLTYGFAYTAVIARGFALAQLLLLLGVAGIFHAVQSPPPHRKTLALAGLAVGAASFTNYLTIFVGLTALLYLAISRPRAAWPAWLAFAPFIPADGYFFAAQHASRPGQFVHFSLPHASLLLVKDSAAAWFGGLPLYVPPGAAAHGVIIALLALAATSIAFIIRRRTQNMLPLAALTLATPAGLITLGLIFNNTPIEIRYLAFSLPYLCLLIANTAPKPMLAALILTQSLAIAGLALATATSQPQQRAAQQAATLAAQGTLILVPFGNDGVGIPGPYLESMPGDATILLLKPDTKPDIGAATRIILSTIRVDDSSRETVAQTLGYFKSQSCWREESQTALTRVYAKICPVS